MERSTSVNSAPLHPDGGAFLSEVECRSGVRISACFQCEKCTSGCPVAYAMDLQPNVLVRHVQLGQRDAVLGCETIWICASCITCSTRCPNDIDLAHVMDALRRLSMEEGAVSLPRVQAFHRSFMEALATHGRIHELELITRYKLRTQTYFEDARLGREMFLRGRINLLPERVRGLREVRGIVRRRDSDTV